MKRFLLFAGRDYYPQGGWDDFVSDHDSAEEAKAAIPVARAGIRERTYEGDFWAHVVDTGSPVGPHVCHAEPAIEDCR